MTARTCPTSATISAARISNWLTTAILPALLLGACGSEGRAASDSSSDSAGGVGGSGGADVSDASGGSGPAGGGNASGGIGTGGAGMSSGGTGGAGGPILGDPFVVFYQGVNLSGAEHGIHHDGVESWGDAVPGTEGSQYAWPNPDTNAEMDDVDILLDAGMNLFRLPFRWERLQRSLGGDFDADYLAKLHANVEALRSRGANVIVEPHNYARYKFDGNPDAEAPLIGSAQLSQDDFVDLWVRLAAEFGESSQTSPIWFGLMNEPYGIAVQVWVDAAQAAVAAIRDGGAQNLILVPGADWDTAADFAWSENANLLQGVTDPFDNLAIEVHQYDQANACTGNASIFLELIQPLETWARSNGRKVFLGESNAQDNAACLTAFDNLLTHLAANRVGEPDGIWIGWAGWAVNARGDWGSFENDGGGDGYLLSTVTPHLPGTCNDAARNGDETATDCGGSCRRCASGAACALGTDCRSGVCSDLVCD